jgi:hypothetical protein
MARAAAAKLSETDLYRPVHDHLAARGYSVQGEVRKCDVAAVSGDELVVVELKLSLNAAVLAQAARRLEVADAVYVAIPKPPNLTAWRRRSSALLYLVRRLELGLLLVSPRARKTPQVRVEVPIRIFDPVKNGKLRKTVLREVRRRLGDFNVGGSVRRKLVSSHRETVIHIACCLERFGPLTVVQLRKLGTGVHTRSVLTASHHIEGWFSEREGGAYDLNDRGRAALVEHETAARYYREALERQVTTTAAARQ